MPNYFKYLTALIIIGITLILTLPGISKPFYGHHEFNGVFYSQIARNYLRLGLSQTKFSQVTTPQDVPQSQWGTHTHHPPTYPLILAAAYKLGGEHEAAARLVSLLATCVSCYLFTILGFKITKNPISSLMIIPLIMTPLWRYYTRMPVFEPILLPFTLWFYLAYLQKKPSQICISAICLVLIDWPGYWPIVGLIGYELLSQRKLTKLATSAIIGLLVGSGIILTTQGISTGNPITDLLQISAYRLNAAPFSTYEWIRLLISRTKAFFGLPVIILTLAGIVISRKNQTLKPLLYISLFAGLAHIVVFRNITWYHDYMLYHLLPFIGITLISLISLITTSRKRYLVISVVIGISIYLTWTQTNKFYTALVDMKPHEDCYTIGIDARNQAIPQEYFISAEKVAECGPFIYYYADKKVTLKEMNTP